MRARALLGLTSRQGEIDARRLQIDTSHLDRDRLTELKHRIGTGAAQFETCRIEIEVIVAQFGDMHQALDEEPIEGHEQAKRGHRRDHAGILLADAISHVVALEPLRDIATGIIGPPLGERTMLAQPFPAMRLTALARSVGAAAQNRLDATMHQQIGIASDRRGEVRVGLVGKPEMPDVVGSIARLLHRAQQHRLEKACIGPTSDPAKQLVIVTGGGFLATGQLQPERLEKIAHHLQLLDRWRGMISIKRTLLVRQQILRRTHIGGEHALLDQPVGFIALGQPYRGDAPPRIEVELGLARTEFDGASCGTLARQCLVDEIESLQRRHDGLGHRLCLGLQSVQGTGHSSVREPGVRPNHGLGKPVATQSAGARDRHLADQHETINVRIERAKTVGYLLGQHRNDAAREVDRSASLEGILIECRTIAHIVIDIGNRDIQHMRGTALVAVNRVIEVT